jgi:hypothetical protein
LAISSFRNPGSNGGKSDFSIPVICRLVASVCGAFSAQAVSVRALSYSFSLVR